MGEVESLACDKDMEKQQNEGNFDPLRPILEPETSTPSPADKSLPTSDPVPPACLEQLQSLQTRISSLEHDNETLQFQLQSEATEREKYQRESEILSAKLSRAEAQVRKVQRQLSVNTG